MIMRKFFVWFFGFLFSLSLALFLITFVASSTVGNGDRVKSWLDDSNTVNLVVEKSLILVNDATQKDDGDQADDEGIQIDLSDEDLIEIGQKLVVPVGENLLVPVSETLIDGVYDWLNSADYRQLSIDLDLAANNKEIKQTLTDLVDQYADKLPQCEPNSRSNDEDMFCIDQDFEAKRFTDEIFKEITGKDGILKVQTLKTDDEDDTFENIYRGYSTIKALSGWALVLTLVFIAGAMFVGRDKFYALKVISRYTIGVLVLPVIFMLLLFVFLPDSFNLDYPEIGAQGDAALSEITSPLIRNVVFDINKTYLLIAIPLLLGAVATSIFLYKKQHNPKEKRAKKHNKK